MTEIPYSGLLTQDELAKILRRGMKPQQKLVFTLIPFLVIPVLAVATYLSLRDIIPALIIFLLGAVFFALFRFLGPSLNAGRLFAQKADVAGPLSGVITDEGVTIQTPTAKTEFKWAVFRSARLADDLVLLYQPSNCFNFFPRRFFASDSDWSEFRRLVAENVSQKGDLARASGPTVSPRRAGCIIYLLLFAAIVAMVIYNFSQQIR